LNDNNINFTLTDYCDLVDVTGRAIIANKKGFINDTLPPILVRLGFDDVTWLDGLNQFKTKGKKAIGTIEKLKAYMRNIKQKVKMDIGFRPALE